MRRGDDGQPLVISHGRASPLFDTRELWAYRELLFFLAWRDVKVRYRQTVLGVAWVALQPLLSVAVFTLLFGRLLKVPSGAMPYPVFAFAALLPWSFFSASVTRCVTGLVGSAHLIAKIYFPRLLIPLATVLAVLVDLAVSFAFLLGLMAYYGIGMTWRFSLVPLALLWLVGTTIGVGLWLSALNIRYRDVGQVVPVLMQIWMYVTPVIYGVELIPERYRPLAALNPMTGVVETFRYALLAGDATPRSFAASGFAASALLSLCILVLGMAAFRRIERTMADVV